MKFLSGEFRLKRVVGALGILTVLICLLCGYAALVEPTWIKIVNLTLADSPSLKLVHITDPHHKGNQRYLDEIVERINRLEPDVVCITGDLVEESRYLQPVLDAIEQINVPTFAVPGNWEHWSGLDLSLVNDACTKTDGTLLVNSSVRFRERWVFVGIDNVSTGHADVERAFADVRQDDRVIFLTHCPVGVEMLKERRVTVALAGHSHGGQVRLPIIGALYTIDNVGRYDRGYFDTPNGPLYVNPGLGTSVVPIRFLCRPEITVISL
jgi:predicted MPP superfamily phosphohydrolase